MIAVIGLSHQSSPIAVREQLAFAREQVVELLEAVVALPSVGEAMLISTCNRVELVTAPKRGSGLAAAAEEARALIASRGRNVEKHLYVRIGGDAVRHLFRVASSLDSLVVGEPQILGQVKDAFELARAVGTVGAALHRTVPRAIRCAKRVRTETSIGVGQVSVPSVAVDLARQIFGELGKRDVVLIGSGEMSETVAKLLKNAGAKLAVVGRNEQRVKELAEAVGGEPRSFLALEATLIEADIVITSTSAPHYVVDYDLVHKTRRKRRGRNLFFVDLAVPRDIDPRVEKVEGVFLYNIDDFSRVVSESQSVRQREAERAAEIVESEAEGYDRWADAARVTPTLVALRDRLRAALEAELEKSLRTKLKSLGSGEREALRAMIEAALNKMLHAPTARLREIAGDREYEGFRAEQLAEALTELFALDHEAESEPSGEEEIEPAEPRGRVAGSGSR